MPLQQLHVGNAMTIVVKAVSQIHLYIERCFLSLDGVMSDKNVSPGVYNKKQVVKFYLLYSGVCVMSVILIFDSCLKKQQNIYATHVNQLTSVISVI